MGRNTGLVRRLDQLYARAIAPKKRPLIAITRRFLRLAGQDAISAIIKRHTLFTGHGLAAVKVRLPVKGAQGVLHPCAGDTAEDFPLIAHLNIAFGIDLGCGMGDGLVIQTYRLNRDYLYAMGFNANGTGSPLDMQGRNQAGRPLL